MNTRLGITVGIVIFVSSCVPLNRTNAIAGERKTALMPDMLNDPLEPMNRGIWAFNQGLLKGVVSPLGRGYRAVVPVPTRKSIRHFSYNLNYPGRVINQLLQGRWVDAGDDSLRFACNTTLGAVGFFDMASKWKIPKPDGDFAQTFQGWGWQPKSYLMLPVVGPSDAVHAVGYGIDRATDPFSYRWDTRMLSSVSTFNFMADSTKDTVRMITADPDPYSTLKYLWTYKGKNEPPNWSVSGSYDASTLQTMAVATFRLNEPNFVYQGKERRAFIPATRGRLPFNYWLQKGAAPVVYIIPGLGGHRLSMQSLVLAEGLFENGYSVVLISGVFHPEFIEQASKADVPGFAPVDSQDLLGALTSIDQLLQKKYSNRIGARALVGCSMGGFETLLLASSKPKKGDVQFDRYVAINPPVNLDYGLNRLDAFQNAPMEWPVAGRQERINNVIHKVSALASTPTVAGGVPPFDAVESKYLIGLAFRFTLRDTIYTTQKRHDLGMLEQPLSRWNREPVYHEILGISFQKYFEDFVMKSYESKGVNAEDFEKYVDLKRCAPGLNTASRCYVITNKNDFLLAPGDIAWLKETLGSKRLTLFDAGGHMGNLNTQAVQQALRKYLAPMKAESGR